MVTTTQVVLAVDALQKQHPLTLVQRAGIVRHVVSSVPASKAPPSRAEVSLALRRAVAAGLVAAIRDGYAVDSHAVASAGLTTAIASAAAAAAASPMATRFRASQPMLLRSGHHSSPPTSAHKKKMAASRRRRRGRSTTSTTSATTTTSSARRPAHAKKLPAGFQPFHVGVTLPTLPTSVAPTPTASPQQWVALAGNVFPAVLLLDTSGSMRSVPSDLLSEAWTRMLHRFLAEGQRAILVITFNSSTFHSDAVSLVRSPAQVAPAVHWAMSRIGGTTHMVDALGQVGAFFKALAAQQTTAATTRPRIVVVTDGNETSCPGADNMARRLAPALEDVDGLSMSMLGLGTAVNLDVLATLSERFGGEAMFAADVTALDRLLGRVIEARFDGGAERALAEFASGSVSLADRMPDDWRAALLASPEAAAGLAHVEDFLRTELRAKRTFFPPVHRVWLPLDQRPVQHVKVVILGQEPYAAPGQAHGLAFSVENNAETPNPPTLNHVLNEVAADVGRKPSTPTGNLTSWAAQGVVLLNTVLTVRKHARGSHHGQGWEAVTDRLIQAISEQAPHAVFMLWGRVAQTKRRLVDESRHLVIESSFPSPFGAHQAAPVAFVGSKPFSRANAFLTSNGTTPIAW